MGFLTNEIEEIKSGSYQDLWNNDILLKDGNDVLFGQRSLTTEVAPPPPKQKPASSSAMDAAQEIFSFLNLSGSSSDKNEDEYKPVEAEEVTKLSDAQIEVLAKLKLTKVMFSVDFKTEPIKLLVAKFFKASGKDIESATMLSRNYDEKVDEIKDIIYNVILLDLKQKNKMGKLKLPSLNEMANDIFFSRMVAMTGERFENVTTLIDIGVEKFKDYFPKKAQ